MEKCPRCGYQEEKQKKAYGTDTRRLLLRYSRLTRQLLRKTSSLIMTNIPSDNLQSKYYNFLKLLQGIDERVIRHSLNQYLSREYSLQGKGFAYLQQIIVTESINREQKLKNEQKIRGKTPSYDLLKGE